MARFLAFFALKTTISCVFYTENHDFLTENASFIGRNPRLCTRAFPLIATEKSSTRCDSMAKHDGFCTENDGFCTNNDGLRVEIDRVCGRV